MSIAVTSGISVGEAGGSSGIGVGEAVGSSGVGGGAAVELPEMVYYSHGAGNGTLNIPGVAVDDLIVTALFTANDGWNMAVRPVWSGAAATELFKYHSEYETNGSDSKGAFDVRKATGAGTVSLAPTMASSDGCMSVLHIKADLGLVQSRGAQSGANTPSTSVSLLSAPTGLVVGAVLVGGSAANPTGTFDSGDFDKQGERTATYGHTMIATALADDTWTPSWSSVLSQYGGHMAYLFEFG